MKTPFSIMMITISIGVLFLSFSLSENSSHRSKKKKVFPAVNQENPLSKTERLTEIKNDYFYASDVTFDDYFFDDLSFNKLDDVLLTIRDPNKFDYSKENASRNGFKIIDRIDRLGVVRMQIDDTMKFTSFLTENQTDLVLGDNVRLSTPAFPSNRLLEDEEPFSGTSMEWLGVNTHRKEFGKGIKVAILDTGIDSSHLTLQGINLTEISLLSGDHGIGNKGHGTGIASIISGQNESFLGLAPSSEILSVRVLGENGEGDSFTIAKGIILAVDEGADIINLSLGGKDASSVMDQAIEYAKSNNVLMVSAVGNDGTPSVAYPARHKDVVAVSSVDAKSRVSSFSNFGPEVDISAPGVGVFTAWEGNEFVQFSGTSIATAFVTGALASELSKSSFQNKTNVINALYDNADEAEKPGKDIWSGRGVLNIRRIEQRNNPGIIDAAVVGYYFDSENISFNGTTPFLITVQNQGTGWIQSTTLKVKYKGLEKDFRIGNLQAGESRSEILYFEPGTPEKKLHIFSEITLSGQVDQFPHNNKRESFLIVP